MLNVDFCSPSPPEVSTIFIPPLAVQIIWRLSDLITVEAMADPKKSINQTKTSLDMNLELRSLST